MKKIIPIVVAIAIIGGISFYGGMTYGKGKASSANQARFQQMAGTNGARGARAAGGFTAGEIISKDDKSVTVKLSNGGSSIVFFTDSTPILKSAAGSFQDLAVGEQITAMGTANQDGSMSAQSIQIRPPQPAKQ